MKRISSDDALKKLLHSGTQYIIYADSLNYLIENEEPNECYEDSDCIVFINTTKDTEYVTVVPMSDSLLINTIVDLINKKCTNPNVIVDVKNLSEKCYNELNCALSAFLKYEKTIEDYIYLSDQVSERSCDNIRLLKSDDIEIFEAIDMEPQRFRPSLHVLFDVFVIKKKGYILGAFDNEKIIGYLSFTQILPDVFDLDYIYVVPDARNLGIGKKLGCTYAKYAHDNNHVAYWSNAKNEASKNTAMSCGFQLIRQAKHYIKA